MVKGTGVQFTDKKNSARLCYCVSSELLGTHVRVNVKGGRPKRAEYSSNYD